MKKYSETTEVTAEIAITALQRYGESINQTTDCFELWQILATEARKASEEVESDGPEIKALWLISDACSMMLNGDSVNAPFGLRFASDNKDLAFPLGFGPLLSEVSEKIKNKALRARLADLAWVTSKPKNLKDAQRAIDAYIEDPPTEENWVTSIDGWRRAVTLCKQLRQGAEGRLEKIEQELVHIAEAALQSEGGLGLVVAKLLFERSMAETKGREFAELLARQAEPLLLQSSDLWHARAKLELAAQWFKRLCDPERAASMLVKIALSFETEVDYRISQDPNNGHIAALSFLEDAIRTLRKVPKDQRPSLNVDEHINRLSLRLTESGENAMKSMHTVSSGKVDITQLVERSEMAVRGKDTLPALIEFARLHFGADLAQMTQSAQESLRKFSFRQLVGSTHISQDGRVIAKTPAGGVNEESESQKEVVFAQIMQDYNIDILVVCKGQIIPAWRSLIQEHTIRKHDLVQLMSLAPIIPPGRAEQFAKGLWEGFDGDFTSAIYLLAPHMEHLVRWHLKQMGAQTTTIGTNNGIENENGLSSLVMMPEMINAFGENICFEIRALFCTPLGPNLRNEVAHGLLAAKGDEHSVGAIYAWWWILRLTLRSFVHSRQVIAKEQ